MKEKKENQRRRRIKKGEKQTVGNILFTNYTFWNTMLLVTRLMKRLSFHKYYFYFYFIVIVIVIVIILVYNKMTLSYEK